MSVSVRIRVRVRVGVRVKVRVRARASVRVRVRVRVSVRITGGVRGRVEETSDPRPLDSQNICFVDKNTVMLATTRNLVPRLALDSELFSPC